FKFEDEAEIHSAELVHPLGVYPKHNRASAYGKVAMSPSATAVGLLDKILLAIYN
ncbi:13260_t:CDS:2, partial [Entrophospora sp. SA101]